MNPIALFVVVPMIISAFVYLIIIIPVETFRPRSATVTFKRRAFGVAAILSYVLVFAGARL